MNVRVIDHLKHANVSLKPDVADAAQFLQISKNNEFIACKRRKGLKATFKEISAVGERIVDGQMHPENLVAFQVFDSYFLAPKKPKDIAKATTLKIRPKKIKISKIFDKKDSEIDQKSRKYWFRLLNTGEALVYESLAYKDFYLSVEGNKVLMRKCSESLLSDENYHIQMIPAALKKTYKVDIQTHTETYGVSTVTSGDGDRKEIYRRTDEHIEVEVTNGVVEEQFEAEVTSGFKVTNCEAAAEALKQTQAEVTNGVTEEQTEAEVTCDVQIKEDSEPLEQTETGRKEINEAILFSEGATSKIPIAVTDTSIHFEVIIENEALPVSTSSPSDTNSSKDVKVQGETVMDEETEEDPIKLSSDTIRMSSVHIAVSTTGDDSTNQGCLEQHEEEIKTTQTKVDEETNENDDVIADCEADDGKEDIAATSENMTEQETQTDVRETETDATPKRKSLSKQRMTNGLGKKAASLRESNRGANQSSFWSKMFSCVSSRNPAND